MAVKMVHNINCRNSVYPGSNTFRALVPDEFVKWVVPFQNYEPVNYTSPTLKNKPWADPNIEESDFKPLWNEIHGNINRKSHMGAYEIVNSTPRNPEGRTGVVGRGLLGRWGPNHAADPIVTQWKFENNSRVTNAVTKLFVLQFCAIQRRDNGQWAIPGGMVDPGEHISATLRREFAEEALNSMEVQHDGVAQQKIDAFFASSSNEIFKGYVDDPRNTDNAWMETVAHNFHDETGEVVGKFLLNAGDDAQRVQWMDIDRTLKLYASHYDIIKKVVELRNAHW